MRDESPGCISKITSSQISRLCMESIYDFHNKYGMDDDSYQNIVEDIVGDVLMGKIKGKNVNATNYVDNVLRNFYQIANRYYSVCHFVGGCDSYTVYRGTDVDYNPKKSFIIHPIPFSTSIDIENTKNWIGDRCCIWRIQVPLSTKLLAMQNDEEGREIILPAGILHKFRFSQDNEGITVIDADFLGTDSYDEMIELQKDYGFQYNLQKQVWNGGKIKN